MRKIFLSTLIYTLVLGAIFGIVVILLGLWNELTLKVLLITGTVFSFSVPGLCCSSLYDKKNYQSIASVGMIVCFVSCIFLIFNILTNFEYFGTNDSYIIKFTLISVLISWSLGHISGLLMEKTNNSTILNIRDLTIVLSVLIDSIWIFRLLGENDDYMKVDAVLAILISLGTIVVPIANKINSKGNSDDTETQAEDINDKKEENTEPSNRLIEDQVKEVSEEKNDHIITSEPDNNVLGDIKTDKISDDDKYDKIEKIKKLLDSKAITQEEYDLEKKKILEEE